MQIHNAFFEDSDANIIFYYCGKDSIIGLSQPDYYFKNTLLYKYARIGFFIPNDISDDEITIYINETLSINIINPEVGSMSDIKSFKVHIEGFAKSGRIVKSSCRCTVINDNMTDPEQDIIVYLTEDFFTDSDNNIKYGLGIWTNITNMRYILTTVEKSFSVNSNPIDNDHYPSEYKSEYLNQITKNPDINMVNSLDIILNKLICESTPSNKYLGERLNVLEEKTKYFPFQYIQNHIWYDNVYTPTIAMENEIINPTSVRGITLDRIVRLDPVNKCFSVLKSGVYMIQLKNGFYLNTGESGLDLSIFKNQDQIKEASISAYLESSSNGDHVIKNLFSSNITVLKLDPSDKIYLKANWSNISDLICENETVISITALIYD